MREDFVKKLYIERESDRHNIEQPVFGVLSSM